MQIKSIILLSLLLYCLALMVRLHGLDEVGIQSDERLWTSRSYEVLKRYRSDLRHVTSHLPHPGLPAALVLAVGHSFREYWDERRNCPPENPCALSVLEVGRWTITLVTTLVIPIIFIGLCGFIGARCAFLAAFLLALDPKFLSYSRIVHIDGMLTLTFTLGLLLYFSGVIRNRSIPIYGAGVCWGLCILSKPSGVLLLPILVAYRALRKLVLGIIARVNSISLFDWRDVWVVVVAHATVIILFTRLWDEKSRYTTVLGVRSPIGRRLFRLGHDMQQHWPYFLLAGVILLLSVLFLWRRWHTVKPVLAKALLQIFALLGLLTAFWLAFPVIVRNIIYYWTWVSGLSGVKHNSYGKVLDESIAQGYLTILATEIPEEILIGFLLGLAFLCYRIMTKRAGEINIAQAGLVLSVVIFIVFLSTSSKQGVRYLLPIMPAFYAIALLGWRRFGELLVNKLNIRAQLVLLPGALLLIGLALGRLIGWYPYYSTYFNVVSGGLATAIERQHGFALVGDIPAAKFLVDQSKSSHEPLFVALAGDKIAMESNARRIASQLGDKRTNLVFGRFKPEFSDYLMVYASHPFLVPSEFSTIVRTAKPIYVTNFKGVDLVSIYKIPYQDLERPYEFNLATTHKHTGQVARSKAQVILQALPSKHLPGYVFFVDGFRLPAGAYKLVVQGTSGPKVADNEQILQLELSGSCNKTQKFELDRGQEFRKELDCSLAEPGRLLPRIYWRGDYQLDIKSVSVSAER